MLTTLHLLHYHWYIHSNTSFKKHTSLQRLFAPPSKCYCLKGIPYYQPVLYVQLTNKQIVLLHTKLCSFFQEHLMAKKHKSRKLEENPFFPRRKKNALCYTSQHWNLLPHKTHEYISKGLTLPNAAAEAPELVPSPGLSGAGVDADQL